MEKDLRSFLKQLETLGPEEWVRVNKKISPKYETTAILIQLENAGRYPAVYFENLEGYSIPAIANLHATRKRIALALGVDEASLVDEYRKRETNRIPPQLTSHGPVQEVVESAAKVNLYGLPLFTHFDISSVPYITAGIVVTKDPITKVRNLSFNRGMVVQKNTLRMHLAPGMHLVRCQKNAEERDEPLEIAIILGQEIHHWCLKSSFMMNKDSC